MLSPSLYADSWPPPRSGRAVTNSPVAAHTKVDIKVRTPASTVEALLRFQIPPIW